jgi:cell division protein FtsB
MKNVRKIEPLSRAEINADIANKQMNAFNQNQQSTNDFEDHLQKEMKRLKEENEKKEEQVVKLDNNEKMALKETMEMFRSIHR